jgi:hypothetical protein
MGVRSTERNREYMREYRAAGRDRHTKIRVRAETKAMKWIRENHPEVWRALYDEAWAELYPEDKE